SNAVALNRVLGSDGTTILGNLSANGKVFIVNPNGVLFGQGASVNTAGLVASTLDINNADFMAGNYKFSGNGTGKVLNQGSISAPGGYVALLGAHVSNEGTITARLGSVALAAGNAITLDVAGDGLLNVAVDRGAVGALVQNGGLIQADGGSVVLTAQAAGDLLKTVVNNTGVIEAHTIDTRSGSIKLLGDMQTGTVNAGGTLDASAPDGGKGGFIDTSAAHVNIANGINVSTKAANGLSGTWLIDPVDFTIAATGGNMTGTDLMSSLNKGSVQIQSTNGSGGTAGDVNVNEAIAWSANKLTLTAQNNINVNAAMRGTGTASLALEYGQANVATGNTSVYNVRSTIDLPSDNSFSTKLGNNGTVINYTVINSLGAFNSLTGTDLQGMRGNLSRNYALGSNIDATATATWDGNQGFTPVGNGTTAFTGKFDGLGHEIAGLHIDRLNQQGGLFGEVGTAGVVRNVALANASVVIFDNSYGRHGVALAVGRNKGLVDNVSVQGIVTSKGAVRTGGLVGDNYGSINNSRSAGSVVYMQGYGYGAGGLVQINRGPGIIRNSSSSSVVNGGGAAGGLVRSNLGNISSSFATGAVTGVSGVGGLVADNTSGASITNSYATGTVTANGSVGGLVGINNKATISNSYASGNVIKTSVTGTAFGGLVGSANSTSVISNSYALGNVTGWTSVGGIVGVNFGSVNNVYSNGTLTELTSGSNRKGGIVGDNTGGSVTNAYFNTTANAGVAGIGFSSSGGTGLTGTTGLTATQMMNPASFTSFNFTAAPGLSGNNWVAVGADGAVNGVNGTLPMLSAEYSTTLYSAHQLQLMAMNLAGNYILGNDLNAASTASGNVWGSTGFVPVGTAAAPFTGKLSGMGLTISGINIAKSGVSDVGLFGFIGATGAVSNLALVTGSVIGSLNVGALAGTNLGTISGSYATVGVTGDSIGGGLVGNNAGTIVDSYASGTVGGNNTMGGLVGSNAGTISTSYANGAVSTGSLGGGLVGVNSGSGSVTGSYWDTTASGQVTSAAGIGLTTAQLKTLANYNSATAVNGLLNPAWELRNMWAVYDGQSAPMLRSFMKQLVVTVTSGSKVYDGTSTTASGVGVNYSRAVDSGIMQGTLTFSTNGGAVNVGTYGLSASGLYAAGQGGYAITYVDGSLSITARQVSIGGVTAGKVYDGTTNAVLSGGSLTNAIDADLANLSISALTGSYASKNAGSNVAINATATLSGSASANYTLAPLTGITGNITPKALTLSGVAPSAKVYDGNTKASLTGGTLDGLVGGETMSVSGLTGAFADKNAGTGKAVIVTGTTLVEGTGLASNYSLNAPTGVTGDITPKALTITGVSASDRVYNGGVNATLGGAVVLGGLVGLETFDVTGMSGVFADKNADTGKAVTISGATLGNGANGGVIGNYTVSNPTGVTAAISKALISSVSNIVADSKVYDANTKATISATGATFNGMMGGDSLSLSATSATFADKNAGNGKTVAVSGIALGGADANNYSLNGTTGSGSGNITPKALTITGMSAVNKVYDGNSKATLSGGSISGLVGSETLGASGLTATFDNKNAGIGKTVTASGATLVNGGNGGLASNYTVSNPTGLMAHITPKALTVTGMTATTRVYDGTLAAQLSGGSLSGLVSGETLLVSGGTGAFADKNAGTGKAVTVIGVGIADGTGLASNYTVSNPTGVTGTITQRALAVTGALAADKTYDGAPVATITGGTLSGMIGSETLNLGSLTGAFSDKNAGTGKAVSVTGGTLSNGSDGGLASNYTVGPVTGLTANIAQKALTLTGVAALNKVYDGSTKASISGGTLNGLVGGETLGLSGVSGAFGDKSAGTGKTVTVSDAVLSDGTYGGLASNYTVSSMAGATADITKASINSVTNVGVNNKTYDGTRAATLNGTATFDGQVAGDSLSVAGNGVFSDKNVATGKTVTVSGITLGGADAGNYTLASDVAIGTADIGKATINGVSGVGVNNKTYDGTRAATLNGTATFDGQVAGDSLSVAGNGVFSDKNAATGKTVTVSGITLGGADAGNYTLASDVAIGTADIGK
ncbi:YDG domain-containing protein, partial [Janthinobacterium sp. MDB2-8]|uniref:YDG domain-containing protein n=1 Tax=Janthinobacterium sp. MDB2-8 TaxID=1259338 RepID=UPI003F25BB66